MHPGTNYYLVQISTNKFVPGTNQYQDASCILVQIITWYKLVPASLYLVQISTRMHHASWYKL